MQMSKFNIWRIQTNQKFELINSPSQVLIEYFHEAGSARNQTWGDQIWI